NVSSGLAFAPKKCAPVYCATKAGLHSFTLSLRNQLEGSPVKVFELIPPLAETAMTEGRGGSKISVREVAEALLKGFAADRFEINVGPVALLRGMLRIAPRWAHSLVKNKA
ncbi:MAG: SDR family NAD(P)-dependent oxidoreductase, partial [Verrucomicrobiae bacterium]|nr:SDR family NAD(P)-dependent oxidoreductase [Verrucomicrobiae bacterium]